MSSPGQVEVPKTTSSFSQVVKALVKPEAIYVSNIEVVPERGGLLVTTL